MRQEVLNILTNRSGLDFAALETHFSESGLAATVEGVLGEKVLENSRFARPGESSRDARVGWEEALRFYKLDRLRQEIREVQEQFAEEPSDEAFRRLRALKELERAGEEQYSGAADADGKSGSAVS